MAIVFKLFTILSLLAGIAIGAYLYVSHLNNSNAAVPGSTTNGINSSIEGAGNSVNNFNNRSQQQLQDVQSQYGQ